MLDQQILPLPTTLTSDALTDFFRLHLTALENLLNDHWYTRKARVSSVELRDPIILKNSTTGSFRARYQVSYTFACEDVTSQRAEYSDLLFRIDREKGHLLLWPAPEPERGPDEL